MPVSLSLSVILALKKVTPEIEKREFLENYVVARLGSLFEKLGVDDSNASGFEILDYDAEYLNEYCGVDVKDLIEDYTFVEGDVLYYDSSIWDGRPAPEEEELSENSFYQFFYNNLFTNLFSTSELLKNIFT